MQRSARHWVLMCWNSNENYVKGHVPCVVPVLLDRPIPRHVPGLRQREPQSAPVSPLFDALIWLSTITVQSSRMTGVTDGP